MGGNEIRKLVVLPSRILRGASNKDLHVGCILSRGTNILYNIHAKHKNAWASVLVAVQSSAVRHLSQHVLHLLQSPARQGKLVMSGFKSIKPLTTREREPTPASDGKE